MSRQLWVWFGILIVALGAFFAYSRNATRRLAVKPATPAPQTLVPVPVPVPSPPVVTGKPVAPPADPVPAAVDGTVTPPDPARKSLCSFRDGDVFRLPTIYYVGWKMRMPNRWPIPRLHSTCLPRLPGIVRIEFVDFFPRTKWPAVLRGTANIRTTGIKTFPNYKAWLASQSAYAETDLKDRHQFDLKRVFDEATLNAPIEELTIDPGDIHFVPQTGVQSHHPLATSVTPEQFRAKKINYTLLDVSEMLEFDDSNLPGSRLVQIVHPIYKMMVFPAEELEKRTSEFLFGPKPMPEKNAPLLIYGRGARDHGVDNVVTYLATRGYTNLSVMAAGVEEILHGHAGTLPETITGARTVTADEALRLLSKPKTVAWDARSPVANRAFRIPGSKAGMRESPIPGKISKIELRKSEPVPQAVVVYGVNEFDHRVEDVVRFANEKKIKDVYWLRRGIEAYLPASVSSQPRHLVKGRAVDRWPSLFLLPFPWR